MTSLREPNSETCVINVLKLFLHRQADFIYRYGINYVAAFAVYVMKDEQPAYIMFSYIMEHIYPASYFESTDRRIALHREPRAVVIMA